MAYVHPERKLIYLAHPRTASVATASLLRDELGFKQLGKHHDGARELEHHPRWIKDALRFTVVRNHYDATVSWAFKQRKMPLPLDWTSVKTLELALDNGWVKRDSMWRLHADSSDVVMRYETIDAELSKLLGLFIVLPRSNVSGARKGRSYQAFYKTPEMRRYIADRFASELERYGYEFES